MILYKQHNRTKQTKETQTGTNKTQNKQPQTKYSQGSTGVEMKKCYRATILYYGFKNFTMDGQNRGCTTAT